MSLLCRAALLSLILVPLAQAQQTTPTPAAAWWNETTALANDAMEGRDTGTEVYERAAKYVAAKFAAAGLKPAGDNGTFFQRVPMHQVDLDTAHSAVEIVHAGTPNTSAPLSLLQEVTLTPQSSTSYFDAEMIFVGYGVDLPRNYDLLRGKVAVVFSNTPAGLSTQQRSTFTSDRSKVLAGAEFAAILFIDNPAATEPTHWPAAYARSVVLSPTAPRPQANSPVTLRISAEAAPKLFEMTDQPHDRRFAEILRDGEAGRPLPVLLLKSHLRLRPHLREKDISSPNILAILPGSDPALAPEFVALSAHLDGYGFGTPVLGDRLYNGALDDAAYVATLLELARTQAALPPTHRPKRSLLFCIFTGEEKGLLGSAYFTRHPLVPIPQIVADLNLDQLRPIFPLKILTMEGLTDSTLGDTARLIALKYGIELRPDLEPERNLFRRADNYNFVRVGVPIASFIFGYDRGTPEERTYRDWYARRYHKPQDDLSTPIDWQAAVTFNDFFRDLACAVANAAQRPLWSPHSPYLPGSSGSGAV